MASVQSAHAATITVTNTNDSGPGSLRDALAIANDGDTIDATGVSGTILLTSGELQINHKVTINGSGAGKLAVNGNATFTVFDNGASNVTISGFTITNGNGGISNPSGALTLSDSNVVNNVGGGIQNGNFACDACRPALTITDSTVSGNSGGGISNANADLTVSNSTISGNSTTGNGGGISSGAGGTNFHESTVTISNSTISGNSAAGDGGAIDNGGGFHGLASLLVSNSTLSGNSATGNGGGIYNNSQQGGGATLELGGTILNAGSSGENIFNNGGMVTSLGYNVSSDNGGGFLIGPGDQINTDPMLGPLQDNGGPTFTHALLPGSPAIDAGNPSFTPPPPYDQRGPGFARVVNGRIDIGSFEVQGPTPTPTVTPTPTPTPTATATPTPTPTATPRPTPTARPSPSARPRPTPVPRP
jgi:hypothetical protein